MVDGMSGVGKGSNNWYTNLKAKWRAECAAKESGQIESEQQQTSGQQGNTSTQDDSVINFNLGLCGNSPGTYTLCE